MIAPSIARLGSLTVDLEEAMADGIEDATRWRRLENPVRRELPGGINIRVILEGTGIVWGLRVANRPVHRWAYKREHGPGSRTPPVAFALALLGGVDPTTAVLDPKCGIGTIPIEAARLHSAQVIGSDHDPNLIHMARVNVGGVEVAGDLQVADAFASPIAPASVDRIACDVP